MNPRLSDPVCGVRSAPIKSRRVRRRALVVSGAGATSSACMGAWLELGRLKKLRLLGKLAIDWMQNRAAQNCGAGKFGVTETQPFSTPGKGSGPKKVEQGESPAPRMHRMVYACDSGKQTSMVRWDRSRRGIASSGADFDYAGSGRECSAHISGAALKPASRPVAGWHGMFSNAADHMRQGRAGRSGAYLDEPVAH